MTFQQHSAWVNFLFESLHREVPPGYSKAGLSQVVSCEKAACARLATLNITTREAADGSFPLGEALLGLKGDPATLLGPTGQTSSAFQRLYNKAGTLSDDWTQTTDWKRKREIFKQR